MSRPKALILAILGTAYLAFVASLYWLKGGLFTSAYEGDLYHHLDIVFRMVRGAAIHTDFVTPLGLLSFLPMVLLTDAGFGVGMAHIWAQVAVAALLLPVTVYAAATRFSGWIAYLFVIIILGLVTGLVHGGLNVDLTFSMHYNRWSWAVSFIVLALAMLPAQDAARPKLDGALIGALMGCLAMTKMTFFFALAPVVLVAILWPFVAGRFIAALLGGVAVALVVTLVYGFGFWAAYMGDLLLVAGSEVRAFPGEPLEELIGGARWVTGSAAVIAAIFLLRRSGEARLTVLLLMLLPAMLYITWQNFGNDAFWWAFLGLVVLGLRPAPGTIFVGRTDAFYGLSVAGVALLALVSPSYVHILTSPLRHFAMPVEKYELLLPTQPDHHDWLIPTDRARTMDAMVRLDVPGSIFAPQAEIVGRPEPLTIAGIDVPTCEFMSYNVPWFEESAQDLIKAGVPEGAQILTLDLVGSIWLFGPFEPLQGGAPWYYGELSGLENAEYIIMPRCGFVDIARRMMLENLKDSGIELELLRQNELYWLFATPQTPENAPIAR